MPLYLWKKSCERNGKNYFWELIRLISLYQPGLCSSNDDDVSEMGPVSDDSEVEKVLTEMQQNSDNNLPCLYCGKSFMNKRGVDTHMRTCDEK